MTNNNYEETAAYGVNDEPCHQGWSITAEQASRNLKPRLEKEKFVTVIREEPVFLLKWRLLGHRIDFLSISFFCLHLKLKMICW